MGDGKTRERRQARTRNAIVHAAEEIIEMQGPDALNMRAVGERIDYSASNLYEYFSSKDELIAAVIKEALTGLTMHVRRTVTDLSPQERLYSYGRMYLEFARAHPELYQLIFGRNTMQQKQSDAGEILSPYNLLHEIVEAGITAGVFLSSPAFGSNEMTFGCWSLVHGIAMLRITTHEVPGEASSAVDDYILKCFVNGLSIP